MTRAPYRRRTGDAVPRAEKFGDLITADHNVLNERGESQNHHRHAVVVQDLATQRIRSYSCKTETSQETEKSRQKFLDPSQKPKVFLLTIHWNVVNIVKNYHGIIEPLHLIDQKQTELQNELYDEKKKEHQPYYCSLDRMKWWSESMECYCYLRHVQDLLADGKTPYERRLGEAKKKTNFSIRCTCRIPPELRKRQSKNSSIRKESVTPKW